MNDAEKQKKLLRMMEEEQDQLLGISVSKKNSKQLQSRKSHASTNLIRCSDCGGQVSTRASSCPKCGCPVDIEQQKAAIRREIIKKERLLSDQKKLLEEDIAKLKTETKDASSVPRGIEVLIFLLIIGLSFFFGWLQSGWGLAFGYFLMASIICIFLSVFHFYRNFIPQKTNQQIDKLKIMESHLELKKEKSKEMADNLKNINSPKVFATLAAGFGFHQMREIRKELKGINESLSGSGEDASGGDSGWGDFEGF